MIHMIDEVNDNDRKLSVENEVPECDKGWVFRVSVKVIERVEVKRYLTPLNAEGVEDEPLDGGDEARGVSHIESSTGREAMEVVLT